MRYALIKDGEVVNVILVGDLSDYAVPSGCTLVQSDVAGPGWSYDGETFSPPPEPEEPV
jgi:hypothetical protein